jgi:chitinase
VLCLKELRAALNPLGYLLTAAVSVGQGTSDTAYDIPGVNTYLDQIHLMAYDMFGAWDNVTGHNAPLFRKHDNVEIEVIHNVEYGLNYWISKGASANKIVLGMPLYGK